MICRCLLPLLFFFAGSAFAVPVPDFTGASWVWADEDGLSLADDLKHETAFLRHSFEVPTGATVVSGVLSLAADNSAEAWVNGEPVGKTNADRTQSAAIDIAKSLRPGKNVIAIRGQNTSLPKDAGGCIIALTAKLRLVDGQEQNVSIGSEESWKGASDAPAGWEKVDFNDAAWSPATVLVPLGGAPWATDFLGSGTGIGGEMPEFSIGAEAKTLSPLRDLLKRHYMPGVTCTLWDPWLPRSLLWVGLNPNKLDKGTREFYRKSFLAREISTEGYVEVRQHRGLGSPDGWPFPFWTQGPGAGWHFSVVGNPYGSATYGIQRATSADDWLMDGAATESFDELNGWTVRLNGPKASLTTPLRKVEKLMAPYLRLEWRAENLPATAQPYVEWTTESEPDFSPQRRLYFSPIQAADGLQFTLIPLYKIPGWKGPITRFRLHFDDSEGAKIKIAALFTAQDTRLPITNPDFILGSTDFFNWTGDLGFLRAQINRLRQAMSYCLQEFGVEKNSVGYVPWPGHEGRSGVTLVDGKKVIRPGEGVGNNYYDLVPFGASDAYLNIRIYAALQAMAKLEKAIESTPQWNIPTSPLRRSASELMSVADRLRSDFQQRFWDPSSKRFIGAIDADGVKWDYGFTPINIEAITYGLASEEQGREIYKWLDGERMIESDTSQGADIYKWRFGPRATTRRNIDYYVSAWTAPESILFGDQIQDGGAVLGFSYYDILARLKMKGPDDAWKRLKAILDWYQEVQAYGGYRKYYDDHDGLLQGGGPPGGLGLDKEFYESVMLPSVLIYGFLGLEPGPAGLIAKPLLPSEWPTLTVGNIVYRDWHFGLTADPTGKTLTAKVLEGNADTLQIGVPDGWKFVKTK